MTAPTPGFKWNPENMQELTTLVRIGNKSASEIGERFGVSRNAILGKLHRMGLSLANRQAPPKPKPVKRRDTPYFQPRTNGITKARWQTNKAKQTEPVAPNNGNGVHLLELRANQCRFPLWGNRERSNYQYCGCRIDPKATYCDKHRLIMTGKVA
jgi:GcrA cell cycle regulator